MRLSNKGLSIIKRFEGLRLKPYLDSVGVPTIGYGNTYYEDGTKVSLTDAPITKERAEQLLKVITKRFEDGVNRYVTSNINQNQFDALVSFAYNVGLYAFKRSTLLKKVNANPTDPSIKNEFLRWNKAGGRVLHGLVRRRMHEASLYFD